MNRLARILLCCALLSALLGTHATTFPVRTLDELIDSAAGNSYLSGALSNLRVHLARVRRMAKDNPARLAASAVEHSKIADAIAKQDPLLASAATVLHLQASLDHILTHAETPKGPHD